MRIHHTKSHQKGIVLPISLVFLVVCTIIAITAVSTGKQSERIASNTQQKIIASEAAESAIAQAWTISTVASNVLELSDDDADLLQPTVLDTISSELSVELDQSNEHGTTVDISVEATFQYCGETTKGIGSSLSADESGVQIVGLLFNNTGESVVANSRAQARHVKRGYIIRPASGRISDCPNR